MIETAKVRNVVYKCPTGYEGQFVFIKGWLNDAHNFPPVILAYDVFSRTKDFSTLGALLAQKGFDVFIYDISYKQQPKRQQNISYWADELLQVVSWVRHTRGGAKPVLIGEGTGNLICLQLARSHARFLHSLLMVYPHFSVAHKLSPIKMLLIRILADMVPKWNIPHSLFKKILGNTRKLKRTSKLKLPLYMLYDLLIALSQSKKLFMRLNIPCVVVCSEKSAPCKYDVVKRLVSKHQNPESISVVATAQSPLVEFDPQDKPEHLVDKLNKWIHGLLLA